MKRVFCLLTSASALALAATQAHGQARPASSVQTRPAAVPHVAAPRKGTVLRAAHPPPASTEEISVFGGGSTRQMTSVSARMIEQLAPGTTVLKALNRLPGVNFQSADPFGAYEYSISLYVRGFSAAQLGFTLDDIPLGDQTYPSWNGLAQNRAVISENVGRANVSQGAGALGVAATSALGGAIQIYTADPSNRMGGTLQQTFGSNDTFRTFARFNSGRLNRSGTKFALSYAHTTLDKWKGAGGNIADQVNFKLVQPIRNESKASLFFDWDQSQQADYQDLSLDDISALGQRWDNYFPDYAAAYNAALGIYTHGETRASDPKDAAYYAGNTIRRDFLSGLTFDLRLTDRLRSKTTFYGSGESGESSWWNPYVMSPNGAPMIQRSTNPSNERFGFLSSGEYTLGRNTIEGGVWYEHNTFTQLRYYYNAPLLTPGIQVDPFVWPTGAFAEPWGYRFNTNTFQFHLQDTFRVTPNITLQAGFRSLYSRTSDQILANDPLYTGLPSLPSGSMTAADAFLPQFSGRWRFLPQHELFFDISKNMRTFPPSGFSSTPASPWSVATQGQFDQLKKTLHPESDWVYEAGYRFTSPYFVGLLSAYRVDFSNRQQALTYGNFAFSTSILTNVGSVQTNGVEASGTLTPFRHIPWLRMLSLYNSISYNRSLLRNDYTQMGVQYPVRGKNIPNMPQLMYKGSLSYSYRGFSADLDVNYLGHRYLDYMNQARVPGYWLTSLGASYRFGSIGPLDNLTLQFNVYNLTNIKYIATMGEDGNPSQGDYQALMPGAPRQFFGTVRMDF
ncbi:TonB-dependent receptor [Gluconacetobacter azotocaptans]|uniref:TonB-dependent receptor domain-containing protein n=1 Tax=Gluconacetobacter azotocaptans TaxID=142834 RepID=UPI00195CBA50|nr:TonB-dependent receptor [Gluconacetobacter azotocaptans]MBM9402909.1 TonB-dependent receptor [Gluconacetobacter azotocaptans]